MHSNKCNVEIPEEEDDHWLELKVCSSDVADQPTSTMKQLHNEAEKISYEDENLILKEDTIQYMAGYLMQKCNIQDSEDEDAGDEDEDPSTNINTYLDLVNQGGLKKPRIKILTKVQQMEEHFRSCNVFDPDLIEKLLEMASTIEFPKLAKIKYFRARIFSRIRFLNRQMNNFKLNKSYSRINNKPKKAIHTNRKSKISRKIKKYVT